MLYLGPARSHIGELVERFDIGWHVDHGDIPGATAVLRQIATASEDELASRSLRARAALQAEFSQRRLLTAFCDLLEGNDPSALCGRQRP